MDSLPKPVNDLSEAIELNNVKVTFGLQPHHIEAIEKEFNRWNDMPPLKSGLPKSDMRFSRFVWEELGKQLGWCPFTLSLYYWEYIIERNKPVGIKEDLIDSFMPFYREVGESCRSGHNLNGRKMSREQVISIVTRIRSNCQSREDLMISRMKKLESITKSMVLSMRAHPDHTDDSEFETLADIADDVINSQSK